MVFSLRAAVFLRREKEERRKRRRGGTAVMAHGKNHAGVFAGASPVVCNRADSHRSFPPSFRNFMP
jgi:hypothetical protein